jgi:hypothetical protein
LRRISERNNFWPEHNENDHRQVKRNGRDPRDGVPCRRPFLDGLGHQIDFAGCEDVWIDNAGQILDGDELSWLDLARVCVFRDCHTRIQNAQRDVVGHFADPIERSVGHIARHDSAQAQHTKRNMRWDQCSTI